MRRILAGVMAFVMAFATPGMSVMAADEPQVSVDVIEESVTSGDFTYEVSGGMAIITGYSGSDTNITIPATLDGYTVTTIGATAFKDSAVETVVISEGVVVLEGSAFYNCDSLTSITIPSTVSTITICALANCKNLSTITVNNNSHFKVVDGALLSMDGTRFLQYPSGSTATSYTMPNSVTKIDEYAFQDSTKLTSVNLSINITKIPQYAFSGCSSLASIVIPEGVSEIDNNAFEICTGLKSVTFPSTITGIWSNSFLKCLFITDVYYCGTEEDWANVSVYDSIIRQKTVHYQAITAPSLTASVNNGSVVLSWGSVNNATYYEIYRADSADGDKTKLATVTNTYYTDSTVEIGKTYYYYAVSCGSSGNSGYSAATVITVNDGVSVTGVALDKTSVTLTGVGSTVQLTATISPTDATDKTLTWSSNNTSVATVSSSGLVTAKAKGTATITVKTNDGSKTTTCLVTVELPVAVEGVYLNKSNLSFTSAGATEKLYATVYPEDAANQAVTWTSSNTSVATVDSSGNVKAVANGTAIITATTADGGYTATCNVTVTLGTSVIGVTLTKSSYTFTEAGDTLQLSATVLPSTATNKNVTWKSSNTSVATVSSSGLVTAVANGSATIIVTTADGGHTATCDITVEIESTGVSVIGVYLTKTSYTFTEAGDTLRLSATVLPSTATNKNITWKSSNTSVATVNSSGTVTAVANGTATITVTTADGGYTATCEITVDIASSTTVAVTGVTLDKSMLTFTTAGETGQLIATVAPANATNKKLTWTSSNPTSVTVSDTGLVTAVSKGTANITVTTEDGSYMAMCYVVANLPITVTGVSLNRTSATLTSKGAILQLTATVTPTNAPDRSVTWTSSNPSVATVTSGGIVTAVANGTTTITVTTTDGNKTATCLVTVNIPVSVTGVTLDATSTTLTSIGATKQLTATVAPADATNKNVTWTSSNTNVATVSSSGLVTAVSNGTATITVITADGSKKATCTVTVAVSVSSVSLNSTNTTLTSKGATKQLTATVAPSTAANKSVTWTSSNTNVATVSSTGIVTAVSNGTATITVTTADGNKTATCLVTVNIPVSVTGVTLDVTSATLTSKGATKQLVATVAPTDATNKNVTWTSSNTNVATVSSTGLVTAVANGTATITVTTADGSKKATCTITVDIPAATVSVTGVSLSATSATLTSKGATKQLTATITPSNATNKNVTWTSSNTSVATVSSTGLVTAVANGTATITVTTADGSKKATCTITVDIPAATVSVTGVSLSETSATITSIGATAQLTATVEPTNATNQNVTWTSSNTRVATVSSNGLVTAVSNGTVTITVITADGSKKATCTITVAVPVTSVSLSATSATLTSKGATKQLTATVAPSNAANKNVSWESSNAEVATVSSTGLVTAVSNGTTTITVKTADGSKTATCAVTVDIPVSVTGVTLDATSTTLTSIGATKQLTATVSPSDATNKTVNWTSSNVNVATVSSTGLVTAVSNGTATITARTADGSKTATCMVKVAVSVTGVSLNVTSATLTSKGATKQLTATVTPSTAANKNVTWTSSNTNVATVSSTGLITAVSNGTTTITVKTADGSKTATCAVTVDIPVSVTGVTLDATTVKFTVAGDSKQLTATVSPTNATNQAVTWTSSNSKVATVSDTGLVTAVATGSTIITVKTADGSKTATCTVTVDIPVTVTGVSLDKTSLTFTSAGTTQTLTATVAPTNAANKNVSWSSSNSAVAVVSNTGVVTALANGTTTITVTTNDGGYKAECKVTVAIPVKVTGVSLNEESVKLTQKGATTQLTATIAPTNAANKNVTWESSNTSVATVSSTGLVTAVANGTVDITVTTEDGGYTATCKVTVEIPSQPSDDGKVTGITLNKSSISFTSTWATEQLTATVSPSNATDKTVTWTSSNESVATVDSNGNVTSKGEGTAIITATTKDGGYTATCQVVVDIVVSVGWINIDTYYMTLTSVGQTQQIGLTINPSNADNKSVIWESENPAVAVVSDTGVVTAIGSGETTVTVTTVDGGKTASCTVVVSIQSSVTGVSLNKSDLELTEKGATANLTATVTPSDAPDKTVTWESSNSAVATVSEDGVVTAVGNGTTTITVTTKEGGYTATCKVTVNIPVSVTGVTLDATSATLTSKGATKQLTATVNPTNSTNKTVTWTSSNTSVATVSDTGLVTAVANGTTTITVKTVDGGYTATCTVTVEIPITPEEPVDPVQAFVERMYTVALGRVADAAGVANWVAALRVNTHDGAGLAEEFILGEEFALRGLSDEEYVDTLYHTFFNREADDGGKELWLAVLASGQSRGYVLSNFVNLPEFTMLCASYGIERGVMLDNGEAVNPGIPQFVKRLYTIVLGREAENEGLYNNVLALVVGALNAEAVAKNFFTSQEYLMKNKDTASYVTDLYAVFMNREADAAGLKFWTDTIAIGMTRDDVLSEFAKSEEFKAIAASYGLN